MREYTQFYINGQWVDPVTPKTLEVLDPSTEEACAKISLGSEADVDVAVAAAKAAFQSFSQTSVEERVGMSDALIHDLEQVRVLERRGDPLFVVELLVDRNLRRVSPWRHSDVDLEA